MSNSCEVIYHGNNCTDGFTAAWIAQRAFPPEEVNCTPMTFDYDEENIPDVENKEVYILDFTFPREKLVELEEKALSLTVLDHHETSKDKLEDLEFAEFDMERSGASMTWDCFFPYSDKPDLVRYVEDRDLWKWEMTYSKPINAAIQVQDKTFERWDELESNWNNGIFEELYRQGQGIIKYKEKTIEEMSKESVLIEIQGHEIPAVNSSCLRSELGDFLCQDYPFALVWHRKGNGKIKGSLRSSSKEKPHVGKIAEEFGGGGHNNAAGFVIGFDTFQDLY